MAQARHPIPSATPSPDAHARHPHALEVATMLGDSVVGVKHLANPRAGRLAPLTIALLAGGMVMLLAAAIAFGVGVDNAAFNEAARHEWIHRLERPAHTFRPRLLGPVYDWLALGGAIGGLLAVGMGLARRRDERQPSCFRIGTAADVEVPLEDAPHASFPLIAAHGDDFVVHFTPGMSGEVRAGGQIHKLSDLPALGRAHPAPAVPGALQAAIPAGARFRIAVGQSVFHIASVPRPRRHVTPLFAALERRTLAFVGGSAAVHLGMVVLLLSVPPAPQALALDMRGRDERITRLRSIAREAPRAEEYPEKQAPQPGGGTGTVMALERGAMGTPETRRASGRYTMKDTRTTDPHIARRRAVEIARNAGILGAIRRSQGGAFASITASADFSSGFDEAHVYGGLHGAEAGAARGLFGFAASGGGPGGGGPGAGTIGAGRYNTIGHGSGPEYGTGRGPGGIRGTGRESLVPQVDIQDPITSGELDRSIIRRRIRRQLSRIKHCYEKQLLVTPDIGGTVETAFQISPQGTVLAARAHGVHDRVARCVARVVESITFPKPRGGGLVHVRYPFTFRAAGR